MYLPSPYSYFYKNKLKGIKTVVIYTSKTLLE